MGKEIKLKIEEWELLVQIKIFDPDGFERTNPNLYNEKFTWEQFKEGLEKSTQMNMTHDEWTSQLERLLNNKTVYPSTSPEKGEGATKEEETNYYIMVLCGDEWVRGVCNEDYRFIKSYYDNIKDRPCKIIKQTKTTYITETEQVIKR